MKTCIIIPARYGSTRFPGKPLAKILGKPMLEWVVDVAKTVEKDNKNVSHVVATDDDRIIELCEKIDVPYILTPSSCHTGSDRVLSALRQMNEWPELVINLQGDVPFTPPSIINQMIKVFFGTFPSPEVITPVCQLDWQGLDDLREAKKKTPFSGTTVVLDKNDRAMWFSKNIIPAIRKEKELRDNGDECPVFRHVGLYGYRPDILEKFCDFEHGYYEKYEGLEQLRLLENGIKIQAVKVEVSGEQINSGIDSPEDIKIVEKRVKELRRKQSS